MSTILDKIIPKRTVCDNLKTGVIKHPREGEIVLNEAYEALGNHYMTAIMLAPVRRPKAKASVEGTVGKLATAVIAKLRNEEFFDFHALKTAMRKVLDEFNGTPFQKRPGNRREAWLEEKTYLEPLPDIPYELSEWLYNRKVYPNCHVSVGKNFYSVPYKYAGRKVDVKLLEGTLEIYFDSQCVSRHKRFPVGIQGKYATKQEDMPPYFGQPEMNGERMCRWADRIGSCTAAKLQKHMMFTMGDIARCSIGKDTDYRNENLLYKLFGVNAELLIDHAWGWEPCTIADIKAYKPQSKSLSSGQVLPKPYPFDKARLIVWEMTDLLALDLVKRELLTDQMVLYISYDKESLKGENARLYTGALSVDHYGRMRPASARGSVNLEPPTSSAKKITAAVLGLFDHIVDPKLLVRRVNICANHVRAEANEAEAPREFDLFTDLDAQERDMEKERRERALQRVILKIQRKYGKNALLKVKNLEEDAMTRERNLQIGGHRQ